MRRLLPHPVVRRAVAVSLLALLAGGCTTAPEVTTLARGDGATGCERVTNLRRDSINSGTEYSIDNALCWIERNSEYRTMTRPTLWLELTGSHMYHLSNGLMKASATALYDCSRHAVYFRKGFDPKKLGGQSILVHELVHHAQCINGKERRGPAADCERETEAYTIQAKFIRYVAGQRPDDPEVSRLIEFAGKLEAAPESACRRAAGR